MEHEVVVQLPAELVHRALQDPVLLARCVPGLSTDAADQPPGPQGAGRDFGSATEEIHGRLRLRVGGSTITYRGVISLIRSGASSVLTAFVEGQEARGDGEVVATVRLAVSEDGADRTVLCFRGDLTPGGRLAEFDQEALTIAGRRLLDRFGAALAAESRPGTSPAGLAAVADPDPATEDEQLPEDLFGDDLSDLIAFSDPEGFGLTAEPENLDELSDHDLAGSGSPEPVSRLDVPYGYQQPGDPLSPEDVLAGPVRRSIVGRSAEEVDHAPPRGRYAPALPARSARARAASRWYGEQTGGAPVAARVAGRSSTPWVIGGGVALIGGAVVLVRVLRRR